MLLEARRGGARAHYFVWRASLRKYTSPASASPHPARSRPTALRTHTLSNGSTMNYENFKLRTDDKGRRLGRYRRRRENVNTMGTPVLAELASCCWTSSTHSLPRAWCSIR